MKQCFKCGVEKERSEFYSHPKMADGLLGKCKTCTKKDARINETAFAQKNPEAYRARNREKAKKYIQRNRQKSNARKRVSKAVARCRLVRGVCEVGVNCRGRVEGHHDDYSKPLTVRWLCTKHHREYHRNNPF